MQIAIIGCGNMGAALAERLSKTSQLVFYDHNIEKTQYLESEGYGKSCRDIKDALHASEMIVLAVKPQNLKQVAALIKDSVQENQIIVSLLAGTPIATLECYVSTTQIIRMMPNLALIYGEGVIGLSSNQQLHKKVKEQLTKIFETLGAVHWISEDKMDALTALAGSGPAFFFAMVEAMVDAGVTMGFTAQDARELVYQMLRGSLTLLEKTNKLPEELIKQIASPKGTTIAGLEKLEELSLHNGLVEIFLAAYERGRSLSSESNQ